MIARQRNWSVRTVTVILLAVSALALAAAPASAKVVHRSEGSFNGSDAPGGPLGPLLTSDAVDQGSSDVYVLESNAFGLGKGVIDKFDKNGVYAGVQITGTPIPGQESFAFAFFNSGVAVDNSLGVNNGDVYVADTEHGVVDKFDKEGKFVCQITGLKPGTPKEEEREEKYGCAGKAGSPTPNGSIGPAGVAVDSSGHLYVADNAHEVIDKFGPAGNYIGQIKDSHLSPNMGTIALDSNGNLYVTNFESNVVKFNAAGSFVSVLDGNPAQGVGVDPATNHVYVGDAAEQSHYEIAEYEPSGTLLDVFALGELPFSGLAVDGPTGKIYAAVIETSVSRGVSIFGPDLVVPTVTTGSATNVQQTSATLNGHVDPDAAHGGGEITECEFEYVTDKQFQEHPGSRYEGAATAPCAPSTPYKSPTDVTANITVVPDTSYHFRLKAANANGANEGENETFTTFGPPAVASGPSTAGATGATVRARINPFGSDTTCQVQYVDEVNFQGSGYASATTMPCTPAALGSGFGDQSASATLTGLHVATTYHYRFIATNHAGTTTGADRAFVTFGIKSFGVEVLDREGQPSTQAGAHPYKLVLAFKLNTTQTSGGNESADANLKDVQTELPPGLVGVPTATPKCTRLDFQRSDCSSATQIGVLHVEDIAQDNEIVGIFNLVPPAGVPAELGARLHGYVNAYIDANVRTGGDYGVTADVLNASTAVGVTGVTAELWGVPADRGHDAERNCPEEKEPGKFEYKKGCASTALPLPFLINPTACAAETARLSVDSWQAPGAFVTASSTPPAFTGCNRLNFNPSISVLTDTSASDSPSGVSVKLHMPQSESKSLEALSTPSLRDALVTLPAGVTLNPAAANGLQACSPAQIGLDNASEPTCPDASKVGSIEIESPLLPDTLKGSAYLAQQTNNPFGSLLALYVSAEADGALIKIAGHVQADPVTGQLTTTFENTPQLPFSDFRLHFFGGPRAPLATPKVCGAYTTTSSLTPWSAPESGPPAIQSTAFQITTGPGGGPCAAPGFAPGFTAGTTSNQAGGFSPLTFTMSRNDGEQNLGTVSTKMPPGLVGILSNVPLCAEAQANEGACPAASQIGHVTVGVGAGPDPLLTPEPGKPQDPVFLTGPYKGAPFGLSIVVPAEAGPFNLDENGRPVVVRATINVDPTTAQVTVSSDPVPQMLQGIPLDVRDVNVTIDRPGFIVNPTSCERMQIDGTLTSAQGATESLSAPFQATNCAALAFKPKFAVSTSGKTSKTNGASLAVKLSYPNTPQGTEANIAKIKVDLPKQLPSRLTTLHKACTAVQFATNPAGCPTGSIVGHAKAITPIVPVPLEGPAYFVSHGGEAFPSLIVVLQGYGLTVDLVGTTFISKAGITSSTFRTVPDAPVGTFELSLPEGKFSALAANHNLCKAKLEMPTAFLAQSGLAIHDSTTISVTGCSKKPSKVQQRKGSKACRKTPKSMRPACKQGQKARKRG
jgi:hypothetical protein